jgi:valyl-tRNA synthetase
MDKAYDHKKTEERIYKFWEEKGYFKPEVNPSGEPYCIILPPPNANAPLHFGHAMYVTEDILIRYHRMKGDKALWLPGADHAGFETQFVFEQKLKNEGKSRFDYDRETLYQMISDYVSGNRPIMEGQLRRLGFSLDWSRSKFTLDADIVAVVYKTFKKLFDDGLVYRAERLINYCTFDGTSFSDLEVLHVEKEATLYFVKYKIKDGDSIEIATTRPETILADVALAVNPKDKRYKDLVGKTAIIPIVEREVPIISDPMVDMKLGTGALKITPGHDPLDFEIAEKQGIKGISIIGFDGKLKEEARDYKGLYPKQAREKIIEELKKKNLIAKEEKIVHQIPVCYKCKNPIEPLFMEQWFVKMQPLAKLAIDSLKKGEIKIVPARFEKVLLEFLESIRDWNVSRQTVWGIRIPAFRNKKTEEWVVTEGDNPGEEFEQDTDTFDTWFSSSQWPFATLETTKSKDFYPTDVLETGYDILRWWVARMIMVGIYATGEAPFKNVLLHGLVNDPLGKKMSKSKGNVIDPMELVDEYGADAVRFALIYGNATGNDQALSYTKLEASRKFANKLWNIARFIEMNELKSLDTQKNENDDEMFKKIQELTKGVSKDLDNYNFNFAAEKLYEFAWHEFADKYIEDVKNRINKDSYQVLKSSFTTILKLLHPFMPFVTEEIYQKLNGEGESIMISQWPK